MVCVFSRFIVINIFEHRVWLYLIWYNFSTDVPSVLNYYYIKTETQQDMFKQKKDLLNNVTENSSDFDLQIEFHQIFKYVIVGQSAGWCQSGTLTPSSHTFLPHVL